MNRHEQFTHENAATTYHCTLIYSVDGEHSYPVNETVTATNEDEAKRIAESRHHVSRRTVGSIEPVACLQTSLTVCKKTE